MVEPNTNISSSQTSYFDMPTAPVASSSSEGESELDDGSDTVTMILSSRRRRRRTARRRRRNRRNILYTHPNYQKGECLHDRGYKQKMLKSETGVVINRREHHHNSGCCCIWLRRKGGCKQEWEEGNPGGTASTNQSGSSSLCLLWFNSGWCPSSEWMAANAEEEACTKEASSGTEPVSGSCYKSVQYWWRDWGPSNQEAKIYLQTCISNRRADALLHQEFLQKINIVLGIQSKSGLL